MAFNKYKNTKTFGFDSKKEHSRYADLLMLEKAEKISALTKQPAFILQEGFSYNGKRIREIKYIADFSYIKDDVLVIEDVKSDFTRKEKVFSLKKKLFLKKFCLDKNVIFVEYI